MKRFVETAGHAVASAVDGVPALVRQPRTTKQKHTSRRRVRPEIAIPVVAGLVTVTVGAMAVKALVNRRSAKANELPKPEYIKLAFSPLDEIDRDLGSHRGWAVADRPAQDRKRPRHQVLVVMADAKAVGMDRTDPHGTADQPALAICTDNAAWWVARLPEDIAMPEDFDPRLVVGIELGRQSGLVACLGRLTHRNFFNGVQSDTPPSDQVMDARHFAECYDAPIVRL